MRPLAAILTYGAAGLLWTADPVVVTVPQQDAARSYADPPAVSVSSDGRYVAFPSYARLAAADTNENSDIYVLDRANGQVTLESPDLPGNSDRPSISGDGKYVVFENDGAVAWVDRERATHRVLTKGSQPSISADGCFVAFVEALDIYEIEVATGVSRRISVNSAGVGSAEAASNAPRVSGDGRFVTFASTAALGLSTAPTLIRGAIRKLSQVFVTDLATGSVTQIGRTAGSPDGSNWAPVISADGRYVAFVSSAINLVPGDRNQSPDIFRASLDRGAVELVSRSKGGGPGNGASTFPAISADGRIIAFQSAASDLVCGSRCAPASEDINLLWDIFVFDARTGSIARLSSDSEGSWMEASTGASLSATGDVVAFSSRHPVNASDTKNDYDLFVVARP